MKQNEVFMNQQQAAGMLGWGVLRDCMAAGWLRPRATKPGRRGKSGKMPAKIIFARADVEAVRDKILAGAYPPVLPGPLSSITSQPNDKT